MGVKIEWSDDRQTFKYVETPFVDKSAKGKSLIAAPDTYIVVDTETTGLDSDFDEIIEVSAIKVQGGAVVDTFDSLVQPMPRYEYDDIHSEFVPLSAVSGVSYVDDFIAGLTGITNDMLATAPVPADVFPRFRDFIGDSVLVGYNMSFDVNFLYTAFARTLGEPLKNDYVDIMRFSRKLFPGSPHHRLSDTAELCGVEYTNAHRAMRDCEITKACYIAMLDKITDFAAFEKSFGEVKAKDISAETDSFDENNPFYQKSVAFTGTLAIPRKTAMQMVANVGGIVSDTVNKKTNYLVIGNLDFCGTIKNQKSNKIIKAEQLRAKGQDISIISENAFNDMING